MSRKDHPVWDVYDDFRSACLNVKYYSARLHRATGWRKTLDIVLAATAPSSAVSGLFFLETAIGAVAWKWLLSASALIAVAKPAVGLAERVKKITEYLTGYRSYFLDLDKLKLEISQQRRYDALMMAAFMEILEKRQELFRADPGLRENKPLKRRLTKVVLKEYPAASFYVPE